MSLSAKSLLHQIFTLRTGSIFTGKEPKEEIKGLIKGIFNTNETLPYEEGRRLLVTTIETNATVLVSQCVKAYPWQESTSWFLNEWVNGTASALGKIKSDTKASVIKALIQGGELNFLNPLTHENKTEKPPSELDTLLAGKALTEIYDTARTNPHLPLIMDAINKKLTKGSNEYSLDSWAEKGVFDSDNQAAYQSWRIGRSSRVSVNRSNGVKI